MRSKLKCISQDELPNNEKFTRCNYPNGCGSRHSGMAILTICHLVTRNL